MKKIILTILAVYILGLIGYWGIKIFAFSERINEDMVREEIFFAEQEV